MNDLSKAEVWRQQLGYLPVPLYGLTGERSFVMLNGGKGNFCLDVDDSAIDPSSAAARAWSADVDHYLAIRGSDLQLLRWDQPLGWSETYKLQDISSKLALFQRYIESKQAPRERSVVTRAVSTYRAVRARAKPGGDREALLAFMGVLATAWKQQDAKSALGKHWIDADEATAAAADLLGTVGVDMVLAQLVKPEVANRAVPSIQLMIRHASGRIFQEAHYLALAPLQQDLFFHGQVTVSGPASKSLGAFFTPTPLVRTLVEQALGKLNLTDAKRIHLFDPACGSGEFLREAVRQLGLRGFKGRIKVTGYDISEAACLMAKFGLAAEACTSVAPLDVHIVHRDALDGNPWVDDVSVCLMNPPFLAWPDMLPPQQDAVSTVLAELHERRPDMAMAFVRLATDTLVQGGVIGAVLPASFLDGSSPEKLRDFLAANHSLELSARLGNQAVFTDVTVDPALIVVQRRKPAAVSESTLLVWADHAQGSSDLALRALRRHEKPSIAVCLEDHKNFSIYTVPAMEKADSWAPRPYQSAKVLSALSDGPQVRTLFSVQQGTITGLNAAFLLNEGEFNALPKSEQRYFRPAVVNESIKSGRLLLGAWVFYPHGDNLSPLNTEQEVESKLEQFFNTRLRPYKDALLRRARISRANWWRLSEYRSWQVKRMPKIVSTYFGAAGSFAVDQSGDCVVVQGYGWIPKRDRLSEQHLLAIMATLNAPLTDTMLAGVSNNLSGGQWNLSKRFVERMPIVDVERLPESLLEALSAIGEQMTAGGPWNADRLRDLTVQAFGLSQKLST